MDNLALTCSIVTYKNDIQVLRAAISSFLDTSLKVKLYIIDNSPSNIIREICTDPRIEYIFNDSNIGFGAGHNIILKDIKKLGKYHLILNPDIRFQKGVLEELYNIMEERTEIGNIMPKIYYGNGQIQYLCKLLPTPLDWIVRMFVPLKSIKDRIDHRFEMRFTDYDTIMNVPYLSGCFMFIRKTVIEDIGPFDENMFMYGEDTDLSRRIYMKYQNIYYPKVSIVHNFEKGSHKNMRLFIIHVKSTIYYLNKWGWLIDNDRRRINKRTIEKYNKSLLTHTQPKVESKVKYFFELKCKLSLSLNSL